MRLMPFMQSMCALVKSEQLLRKEETRIKMDQQELHEFPVIIEETNKIITLFLNKTDKEKAIQGKIFIILLRFH